MNFLSLRNKTLLACVCAVLVSLLVTLLLSTDLGFLAAPSLAELAPRLEADGAEEGEGGEREDWLYRQRAYPAETIPAQAGQRMIEQLAGAEARLQTLRAAGGETWLKLQQERVWAALGPQPITSGQTVGTPRVAVSGRVSAIALDPRYDGVNNQTIYLGGAQGGVWKSTDNGRNWTPLTDNQNSLATGAIAVDPRNPDVIYVGTGEGSRCALCYYGAGLLKSIDGGQTWAVIGGPAAANTNQPAFLNAAFTRIVIDPGDSNTIYVATTFGATATANSNATQVNVGQVGVWKSTDAGQTWRNLDPDGTNGTYTAHDIIVDPQNPQYVYAAMRTLGIYRSTQGGAPGTWTRLGGGLPDPGNNPTGNPSTSPFRRLALASGPPVAPSPDTTLYAAFAANNSDLLGIWRSTDNGATWAQAATPQQGGQANYNLDIAVDPSDGNTIYYGTSSNSANDGGTFWRSRDGGQSWTDQSRGNGSSGGLHVDTHQIVVAPLNPDLLVTGNDGGIWRTESARSDTIIWQQLNSGLSLTQFIAIALHPSDPNVVIGGTQDNGTNIFEGTLNWQLTRGGDGGFTLIDQARPEVLYHTFFNQNNENNQRAQLGPEVSLNSGASWRPAGCFGCTAAQGNINPADRVAFYAPLALNSAFTGANGNVIYFGTHRLYRSANNGTTWTGLGASSDGFGRDLTKGSGEIATIAASAQLDTGSNPAGETVWVGTGDGNVQVTSNAARLANATFTNVTRAPLPNRYVTDIAADNRNAQRAVVVYSGFDANTPGTPGHVFMTSNRGGSWTNISGNLPDVPVTSVALHPNDSNTIFIGTDLGVFQTGDGGATWVRLGNGMPRVAAFMVRYHAATDTLYAATHGRGVYRLALARTVTTVSAANFDPESIASEAIVAAFGTNLAVNTVAASALPLPAVLAGTRVVVRDSQGSERLAPLFFVAPTQINYQIPAGTSLGTATVLITANDGTISLGTIEVNGVAPSLFAANADGRGVPAGLALRIGADGAQQNLPLTTFEQTQGMFVPTPIDLGAESDQTFLILFGTGIRFRSNLQNVTATLGGEPAEVVFAGAQSVFVGLDQINLRIPRSLIGRGEVEIVVSIDGKPANIVRVSIK